MNTAITSIEIGGWIYNVPMNLITHTLHDEVIVEATSDSMIINHEQDVITILEEIYSTGTYKIILHQKNIVPEFWDLSTGLAGAVLQKFINYSVQMAIVGDFTNVTSKSLTAFIYESNQGHHIFFVDSVEGAIQKLSGRA